MDFAYVVFRQIQMIVDGRLFKIAASDSVDNHLSLRLLSRLMGFLPDT